VLKVAERDQLVNFATSDNFSSFMNPEGARKSAGTAAFFSMLLPGFGQVYNGHFVKGIIFVIPAVLAWIGVLNLGIVNGGVTGWFLPSIVLLGIVYVVAIIDAAVVAGRTGSATPIRPNRPVPPVDKPFE
jgi:TM2 domain-containing membrane protein YozV